MIKLGSEVRDIITGFKGIATGRNVFLYGCVRILIEPAEMYEGKPVEGCWFDEQRIEVIEKKAPEVSKDSSATSGGPQNDNSRRSDSKR